jgi:hypothetical protein
MMAPPPDVRALNARVREQARACGAPSSEADPVRGQSGPSSEAEPARGRRTPSNGAEPARGEARILERGEACSRRPSSGPPGGPLGPSWRGLCPAWLRKACLALALLRVLSGDFPVV